MIRILVPLDGSHFGEAILATVAKLSESIDAEVELLAVYRPSDAHATRIHAFAPEMAPVAAGNGSRLNVPLPAEMIGTTAESRTQVLARVEAELRQYLQRCAQELPHARVNIRVDFSDDPGEAIIRRARYDRFDLIAMATHGRTGLGNLLAGSVCEQVIRSGVAPVVVLRP